MFLHTLRISRGLVLLFGWVHTWGRKQGLLKGLVFVNPRKFLCASSRRMFLRASALCMLFLRSYLPSSCSVQANPQVVLDESNLIPASEYTSTTPIPAQGRPRTSKGSKSLKLLNITPIHRGQHLNKWPKRKLFTFNHADHAEGRGKPRRAANVISFCTSPTPTSAWGCARKSRSTKSHRFCILTTPISADGVTFVE